jgi:SAM-dependent methyltransferase
MEDAIRAKIYDAIYAHGSGKNYAAEASEMAAEIKARATDVSSVLGVACGSGLHLVALRDHFPCVEGTETFGAMCEMARQRTGGMAIHLAEAATIDLGRTFDAVVVLFSTISRPATYLDLVRSLFRLRAHLRPGGVILVDPWYTPEEWHDDALSHAVVSSDDGLVVRAIHTSSERRRSTSQITYLYGEPGKGVSVYVESRNLTLFTYREYLDAFAEAGFVESEVVRVPPRMRPRIVGQAPTIGAGPS